MAESSQWAFPERLQPRAEEQRFDLGAALDAVVLLRAEIPADAFTAPILGTVRTGNGAVIREDGLVLTIGYLITEAHSVWLTANDGATVPAHPLAYDQVTGFGLVQPLGRLGAPALPRGRGTACAVGEEVIVASHGGRPHALRAEVILKREFAGYWEYVLDEALFTAPAHPEWGGSALIGSDGRLLGIGSLLVQESVRGQSVQGNMMVPVDLLEPIFDDMLRIGRPSRPPRAWLGLYATEGSGPPVVRAVTSDGPADRAGVQPADLLVEVAGDRVMGLADLFRKIWRRGPAGTEIPLTIARGGRRLSIRILSADRSDFLKKPLLH